MAGKRSAKKYLDYKAEVRRIAVEYGVDLELVEKAFAINETARREIIDMKDLLFVAGMLGHAVQE